MGKNRPVNGKKSLRGKRKEGKRENDKKVEYVLSQGGVELWISKSEHTRGWGEGRGSIN